MSVRRFVGANSRDVMRQVREALGDDALIVANRRTETGVEILAMADDAALDTAPAVPAQAPAPAPAAPSAPPAFEELSAQLLREMQDMRALLARPSQGDASVTPDFTVKTLLARAGFGAELCEEIGCALPATLAALHPRDDQVLAWLHRQLEARLSVLDGEDAFFDRPGIVALVGPTGVGKTTTTAKLAARFVMRHGTEPVALVTTDSFRIGAHEQLRIYARLLDAPMYALDAEQPVNELLDRLHDKRWVIVDTVGMSQRDQRVITQIDQLQGGDSNVRLVLVLNAASQPETLEEVVLRYRQAARAAGATLDDCIITKQDEAGRLAPLLDIVMRHGLRVLFGSHGQQVPEDMAPADRRALVEQALRTQVDDARTWPGTTLAPRWSQEMLGQGRRLSLLLGRLRERVEGFALLETAWDIAALPAVLHDQRLDEIVARADDQEVLGIHWAPRRNARGVEWSMPDLALDADGHPCALTLLQHRQSAGWQPRIAAQARAAVHLLPTLVDGPTQDWLEAERLTWVSQVSGSQRVYWQGERYALAALFAESRPSHHVGVRFRGQALQLWSVHAEVADGDGRRHLAWYGEIRDPESAKRIAKRYWLTPARLGIEVESLLTTQLQGEASVALAKRAWQVLKDADGGETSPQVRLAMAAGAAAVATHLDGAEDDTARALREDVMRLGRARARRDTALLDAVMHLLMTRDAIRQLGSVGREAFA